MMTIRFWGVRGSIATGGGATAQVGGNTSCVEVRCAGARVTADGRQQRTEQLLILDAGTGLRALGADLLRAGAPLDAHLLLSHFHWDHIQGFPFFAPAYVPGHRITLWGAPAGATTDADVRSALAAQMSPPHFPVGLDAMRADLAFRLMAPGARLDLAPATVHAFTASHPGGCVAYRVECGGRSLVYATDTEHDDGGDLDPNLLAATRGADVLIYDAQYTAEEYRRGRRGWGHSTAEEGTRLARAAGAGQLVLFHHDPSHDDAEVCRIETAARALFPNTVAAREGMVLQFPSLDERVAA